MKNKNREAINDRGRHVGYEKPRKIRVMKVVPTTLFDELDDQAEYFELNSIQPK